MGKHVDHFQVASGPQSISNEVQLPEAKFEVPQYEVDSHVQVPLQEVGLSRQETK